MSNKQNLSTRHVSARAQNKRRKHTNIPNQPVGVTGYRGVQAQKHMRKDGLRTYYYHRATGTRLLGEPGSVEFDESYREAEAKAILPKVVQLKWRPKRPRKAGVVRYVYFVQCDTLRHIKIGASQHPWTRFINIQTSCPDSVTLLGVIREPPGRNLERELQARFARYCVRGEWHAENEELADLIRQFAEPAERVRLRYDLNPLPEVASPSVTEQEK